MDASKIWASSTCSAEERREEQGREKKTRGHGRGGEGMKGREGRGGKGGKRRGGKGREGREGEGREGSEEGGI